MINLQRLRYLKEHTANDSLQFVARYILRKIQRDRSEFSRYRYAEDWSELDLYLHNLDKNRRPRDLKVIHEMLNDISDSGMEEHEDHDFEKALIQHLDYKLY